MHPVRGTELPSSRFNELQLHKFGHDRANNRCKILIKRDHYSKPAIRVKRLHLIKEATQNYRERRIIRVPIISTNINHN